MGSRDRNEPVAAAAVVVLATVAVVGVVIDVAGVGVVVAATVGVAVDPSLVAAAVAGELVCVGSGDAVIRKSAMKRMLW